MSGSIPDLDWYTGFSERKALLPRCPDRVYSPLMSKAGRSTAPIATRFGSRKACFRREGVLVADDV
jgi:hypothetical protein